MIIQSFQSKVENRTLSSLRGGSVEQICAQSLYLQLYFRLKLKYIRISAE